MKAIATATFLLLWAFALPGFLLASGSAPRVGLQPFATLYLDWHATWGTNGSRAADESEPASQFEIERLYFGFEGRVNERRWGRFDYNITFDVQSEAALAGKTYWAPYLKFASLEFKLTPTSSMAFGLQESQLFSVQERMFVIKGEVEVDYRGALRTFMELNEFGSASDLGATIKRSFPFRDKSLEINAFLFNGDGYDGEQDSQTLAYGVNATYTIDIPHFQGGKMGEWLFYGVAKFGLNLDDDFRPGDRARAEQNLSDGELISYPDYEVLPLQQTYAGMVGLRYGYLSTYFEFATQRNYKFYGFDSFDYNAMGTSFFASWGGLYVRYDRNLSDVYDAQGDEDGFVPVKKSDGEVFRSAGDAGTKTFWVGLLSFWSGSFQTILSYRVTWREAYDFEVFDSLEQALLVDLQFHL